MGTTAVRRVLVPAIAAAVVSGLAAGSAAAATTSSAFVGSAYGSTAQVGTIARSGPTSLVSACSLHGYRHDDHAAAVHLGPVGNIGAVTTRAEGTTIKGALTETSTSTTGTTSLLGGLVQARTITTRAVASRNGSTYHLSGSTSITGLRINNRAVTATPKPNQQISVPGVATVTLNVQGTSGNYNLHQSGVTGMRITVLSGNRLGLPAGVVVVGHAVAGIHAPVHARPYGSAFATQAKVGSVLTSGPSAPVSLPCGGSAGKTVSNPTAAVRIGDAVSAGAVSSSASSTDNATATTATTQSKVTKINLLHGVVSADAVTARANASLSKGRLTRTSTGTTITGLKINGKRVSVSAGVKANTKIPIAGVGTLWLNRSVNSGTQIQVNAMQLHLDTARAGLKAGADIDIAVARAGVIN